MNKKATEKTAICYWSTEDDCYVVTSPLCHRVVGIGNSPGEAWETFFRHLDWVYTAFLEGQLAAYEKRGRPAKDLAALNVSVQRRTKQSIVDLSLETTATQGEVVDFLAFFYGVMKSQELLSKSPVEPFSFADGNDPEHPTGQHRNSEKWEQRAKKFLEKQTQDKSLRKSPKGRSVLSAKVDQGKPLKPRAKRKYK